MRNTNSILDLKTREGFEKIFHDHYNELCSYAKMFLNDLDAGEEIVQEIFVKFWENKENIHIKSSPRSYLYRSVRNSCLNFLKHQKIEEEYKHHNEYEREFNLFSVDDEYEGSELEVKIRNAIEQLPPERKKVFLLSRFEGLKYKEIAEKQGISIKTVENQMGKAIKFLKQELSDYTMFINLLILLIYSDI